MSNYQRLISYIYDYEGGVKGKNIGFAKLETRGAQCRITVSVKKVFIGGNSIGVYLLSGQEELRIGTLFARNGAGEFRIMVNTRNVEGTGRSLEECFGLTVHDTESAWRAYTTIWEDAVAHAAEVELADVTSEKVLAKAETKKGEEADIPVRLVDASERDGAVRLPISEEIEGELEREELERLGILRIKNKTEKPAEELSEEPAEKPAEEPQAGAVRRYIMRPEGRRPGMPEDRAPEENVAEGNTPEENTAGDSVLEGSAPEESAPEESAPEENVPEENVPKATAAEERVAGENVPGSSATEDRAPEGNMPVESVPGSSATEDRASKGNMSVANVPEANAPEGRVPEESASEENVPEESAPKGNMPMENVPGSSAVEENAPKGNVSVANVPKADAPDAEPENTARAASSVSKQEAVPPSSIPVPFREVCDGTDERELWERLRKQCPKILAFDYADGCEILAIKPQDIGLLSRENWIYGNNSFLLHGYYNYRHLILARLNQPGGRSRFLLGIPGHFQSGEKYMAAMFGFTSFVLSKKQPPRDSRFGYWYTDIKLGNESPSQ